MGMIAQAFQFFKTFAEQQTTRHTRVATVQSFKHFRSDFITTFSIPSLQCFASLGNYCWFAKTLLSCQ